MSPARPCWPIDSLLHFGGEPIPPRTCRTRIKNDGSWRWKKLYPFQEDAVAAARQANCPWYKCVNCGFHHLGHPRKRPA